jgi:hypothetical protein
MALRVEVDGPSHAAAVARLFARAGSADELLDVLLDVTTAPDGRVRPRLPFGADLAVDADRMGEWYRDVLQAVVQAAAARRRGKYRGAARPAPPRPGTLWESPERGLLLVLCATEGGLVLCAPAADGRWRVERLVAVAAADFAGFQQLGGRAEGEAAGGQGPA